MATQLSIVGGASKNQQQSPPERDQSNESFLKSPKPEDANVLFQDPTIDELQIACDIALRTYYDPRVFITDSENCESMDYIQKLFAKVPSFKTVQEKEKDASKERPLVVKCELIRWSGLPGKDTDGKSNLYCKIVILDEKYINHNIVQKENIDEWISADLVDKQAVFESSVILSTLEPEWNDPSFELDLQNPNQEYLVIEVWNLDKDDQKKKIKELKKFLHLKPKNGFMGRAFYPLKNVSVKDEEEEMELYSHSKNHRRGTLSLKLSKKEKERAVVKSENEKFEEHEKIMKVMMACESKQDNNYIRKWNGELCIPGQNLLTQHATLTQLSKLGQAVVRFSLLMDYHKSYAVSIIVFQETINEIYKYRESFKEIQAGAVQQWVHRLTCNIAELYNAIVSGDLGEYSLKLEADMDELKAYLTTFASIHKLQTFLTVDSPDECFNIIVINAIQEAVPVWFHDKLKQMKCPIDELFEDCLKQCHQALDKIQPVFKEVGIDYFSPFLFELDKLLYSKAKSVLSSCSSDDTAVEMSYKIYKILQKIEPYTKNMDKEFLKTKDSQILHLDECHELFKEMVPFWIELAQSKAMKRVDGSVEQDNNSDKTSRLLQSANDTTQLFIGVFEVWKNLEWPNREQSFDFLATTIKKITELAVHYIDLVSGKVTREYCTDPESGKYVISDKLCRDLHSIHHIQTVLPKVTEEADKLKFHDENDRLKATLTVADNYIKEKKDSVFGMIHKLVLSTVENHVKDIVKADNSVHSETAFEPLLDYIRNNIGKLKDFDESFLHPNFLSFLQIFWGHVIQMLKNEYLQISHESVNLHLFLRLKELANTLMVLFESGGSGLDTKEMKNQLFETFLTELSYAAMSTQELIKVFFQDLVQQQQKAPEEGSILRFSHLYHTENKALEIHVVSAEIICAPDKSGKIDSFIEVHLLPIHLFPEVYKQHNKTKELVLKQTPGNFFFYQKFSLSVDSDKLMEDGVVLLLAMFVNNSYAGVCVVPTNTIPQGTNLNMEHLNVFQYTKSSAYVEIDKRSTEKLARKFLKLMKFNKTRRLAFLKPGHRSEN